jgi:two-component system sensor histidine kinase AlgZ
VHPILAQRGTWLLWAIIWVAFGVALGILLARLEALAWWAGLVLIVPLTLVYGFICSGAYYLCRIAPLRRSAMLRVISVHGIGALISSEIWLQIGGGWARLLQEFPWLTGIDGHYWRQSALFVSLGVVLFLLSSAVHYILIALDESREAETRALRLQMLATEAELRALRSQITPHFLFNSLNSINALTSSDPAGARRMCLLLSEFLRGTLQVSTQERILLAQELALIDQFLSIEQVRFGDRLRVQRDIDEESSCRLIPPLLLQPLVENAITHGIADLLEGGTVRIAARNEGPRLLVTIENPRDPAARRRAGAGLGLSNVRRRLEALYGRDASLVAENGPDRFRVELSLPASAAHEQPRTDDATLGQPSPAGRSSSTVIEVRLR